MNGLVTWFNKSAGYGYITGDDGITYYVHYTSITKRPQRLTAGQRVSFVLAVSQTPRALPEAEEVNVLGEK